MDRIFFENTTTAIGIYTDPVNNHETIVLGEPEEIRQFFRSNTPTDRIFVCDRHLGMIADDLNRISDNRKFMTMLTDTVNDMATILKEAQGKEAVAPCFEKLGNIFTESIQRNMIQNYLIYSVSALYNTKLAELNSSVKLTKKALHKVSDELSAQFLAEYDDLIRPFILLQEDEKKKSYWSIKEQIEQNECDSIIHIVRSHKAKGWQTFYIAEESFTAFMSLYIEQLSQANLMVRNCDICGKLYLCKKNRYPTVCGDAECKSKQHTIINVRSRKKAMANPFYEVYAKFSSRCSNYRRKMTPEQRKKYDVRFSARKKELLAFKKNLTETSPYAKMKTFKAMCDEYEFELKEYSDVVRE